MKKYTVNVENPVFLGMSVITSMHVCRDITPNFGIVNNGSIKLRAGQLEKQSPNNEIRYRGQTNHSGLEI